MLEVKNISKSFGEVEAVKDVSFRVEAGSIYTLIGPNGSGKTTLMKLASGLLQIDSGSIVINGAPITKDPESAKAKTGYIPDNPQIWSKMTGKEFLDFTGALYGVPKEKREERIGELLKIFSLEGVEHSYFEHYSRGNRQKFAILAALLPEPKLLLVDEPIVGLDPESAKTATDLFRRFADDGGAVLIVTHTLSAVEGITNKVGVLSRGSLKASGTPDELRERAHLGEEAGLLEIYSAFTKEDLHDEDN